MHKPKLSVCIVTYNQENFISQTLDSVLSQKTNFPYEVIIGDDGSTDNTPKVILEYKEKYPEIVKPILKEKNLLLQGKNNYLETVEKCSGEYIAYLDGDDFWCDENKLQKQVDFLDNNPDYSLVGHDFYVIKQEEDYKIFHKRNEEHFADEKYKDYRTFDLNNLFDPFLLISLSVVYRRELFDIEKYKKYKLKYFKDIVLFVDLLLKGKGAILNQCMGVYRISNSGIWSLKGKLEKELSNTYAFYTISELFNHSNQYFTSLLKTHIDLFTADYKNPLLKNEINELIDLKWELIKQENLNKKIKFLKQVFRIKRYFFIQKVNDMLKTRLNDEF